MEASRLPKLRQSLKNYQTWEKKEDIRVHDSAFSSLNVSKEKLMFVIVNIYRHVHLLIQKAMLLISSQFSLTKYISCYYSSRKELLFKRKNKSLPANGAKAKLIGF